MIKKFSCGHALNIHSVKDSRRITVDFPCPVCRGAIPIRPTMKTVLVGKHSLVIKRTVKTVS